MSGKKNSFEKMTYFAQEVFFISFKDPIYKLGENELTSTEHMADSDTTVSDLNMKRFIL